MERSIETYYDNEGIIDEERENAVGTVTITYINRNQSYKNGVLCGLMGLCVGSCDNGLPVEIEEVAEEDWYFDTLLTDILDDPNHKRYVVCFEQLENYGIYFATDDIVEFVSWVASCPQAFQNSNGQNWETLKYADANDLIGEFILGQPEAQFFNKTALDLQTSLVINMVTIAMTPL